MFGVPAQVLSSFESRFLVVVLFVVWLHQMDNKLFLVGVMVLYALMLRNLVKGYGQYNRAIVALLMPLLRAVTELSSYLAVRMLKFVCGMFQHVSFFKFALDTVGRFLVSIAVYKWMVIKK